MESFRLENEALIALIESVFPDPGCPVESRPCPHRCEECDDLSETFRGRRWHEIAALPMLPLNAAPALLGDDAYRYFLPGLMVGCLRDPIGADVTLDFISYGLLDGPARHGLLESLSPDQRGVVYDYLERWLEEYDDDSYRRKFRSLVERIPPDARFEPPAF